MDPTVQNIIFSRGSKAVQNYQRRDRLRTSYSLTTEQRLVKAWEFPNSLIRMLYMENTTLEMPLIDIPAPCPIRRYADRERPGFLRDYIISGGPHDEKG